MQTERDQLLRDHFNTIQKLTKEKLEIVEAYDVVLADIQARVNEVLTALAAGADDGKRDADRDADEDVEFSGGEDVCGCY